MSASENDGTFSEVVVPLVEAFRQYGRGRHDRFVRIVDELDCRVSRIGGSIAQRDLIALTRQAALARADLSRPAPDMGASTSEASVEAER